MLVEVLASKLVLVDDEVDVSVDELELLDEDVDVSVEELDELDVAVSEDVSLVELSVAVSVVVSTSVEVSVSEDVSVDDSVLVSELLDSSSILSSVIESRSMTIKALVVASPITTRLSSTMSARGENVNDRPLEKSDSKTVALTRGDVRGVEPSALNNLITETDWPPLFNTKSRPPLTVMATGSSPTVTPVVSKVRSFCVRSEIDPNITRSFSASNTAKRASESLPW